MLLHGGLPEAMVGVAVSLGVVAVVLGLVHVALLLLWSAVDVVTVVPSATVNSVLLLLLL